MTLTGRTAYRWAVDRVSAVVARLPDQIPIDPWWPPGCLPKAGVIVSKRTFQPNNRRRAKTHGFRLRMRTRAGRSILSARSTKGRKRIAV